MATPSLAHKTFYRSVFALVIPMALNNLINVAVQSADVIMLGMVGEVVLSASSLAGQVQFIMMLILFGLASGASVLTAQYWGKGDLRAIEKVMAITLRISMVVALVFFCAAMFFPYQLMRIFTPEADVAAYGVQYLRAIAPSYLIIGFTNIYLNIMRSTEKVIISTVTYSVSLVVNISLNALLIFGLWVFPRMGIQGAALATTLARVAELAIVVVYAGRNKFIRLRFKDFLRRHTVLTRDFIRYALPTTLNETVWSLGISANAVIIGHLGAQAVAANSVAQVVRQLATVVSFGVANAAAILIGKALGGGDAAGAKLAAGKLIRLSLITGGAGAGLILVIRPFVVAGMNLSAQASDYLSFLLLVMCVYVLAQAFCATMVVGIFRGGGDTRFGLFLDFATMWCFSILLAALGAFVFGWPIQVVFAVILMDELVKVPLCIWRYRAGRWLRNVTREKVD